MTPAFIVGEDLEALSLALAERIVAVASEVVARSGRCAIALAGGSTPRRLYQLLAAGDRRVTLSWPAVCWWWSDERCVPPDDRESNFRLALETLLGPAGVGPERIHRIEGERPAEQAALAYEALLRDRVPDGALDIVLLGAGSDGHTASLFPGSPALAERVRWVVATEAGASQAVPTRVTFTYPLLDRAREVFVLAAGTAKRAVVRAVREDVAAAARRYPVARLSPAGRLTWYVDREAAGA